MLTDTHCHLDSEAFDADRGDVIARARAAGLGRMLTPGVDLASSEKCVAIASEHECVCAAIGIHPTEAQACKPSDMDGLRQLARRPKVVAVGEIGLDYYWVKEADAQARQRELLGMQLRLASDLGKPVVLHARESGDADRGPCSDDLLALLEAWLLELEQAGSRPALPGVLHSFSSSPETARRAIEMGFLIGVTGPITYKNAEARRAVISTLPLEALLIETDSPYLAPEPFRGKRNEPAYIAHIADKIAAVQSRTIEEVVAVTAHNAARLFSWGGSA